MTENEPKSNTSYIKPAKHRVKQTVNNKCSNTL